MTQFFKFLSLGLALVFALACGQKSAAPNAKPALAKPAQSTQTTPSQSANFPAYVLETLAFVKQNARPPEGFVGGREFQNREKRLPLKSADGQKIRYREWDVHPKIQGKNRGAERLVTGSDGSAWFTKDHYSTFTRIE